MMDSITRVNPKVLAAGQTNVRRLNNYLYTKLYSLLIEKGWLLCIVGFLLGRAVVLSVVSPFALALLATLWLMQRDKTFKVMIATAAGAFSFTLSQGVYKIGRASCRERGCVWVVAGALKKKSREVRDERTQE